MSTLGAEIAAARLMAPFFGSSTIIWANTIAVVLLALSAGYKLGGVLADRRPDRRSLRMLVLVGSALLAVVPFIAHPFLSLSVRAFDELSAGAFTASLFGTLVLVAMPLLLLGAVSPWATRLRLATVEEAGVGRRAAVRDLDDRLARRRVLRRAVVDRGDRHPAHVHRARRRCPALVAALGLGAARADRAGRAGRGAGPAAGDDEAADDGRVLFETETPYQYARVVERPDGTRRLELNEGQAIHSLWRPGTVLTGGYWDGFLVLPFATGTGKPPERIAALGTAGGTVPRAYAHYFPDTRIDAVDIDPELFAIGRRYFGLEAAAAAARDRRGRAAVPAPDRGALRLDLRRRLPPAVHPVLPDHPRVLRAGARPAEARRLGDHQHRPPGGIAGARAGAERDHGRGVRARRPRTDPAARTRS